LGKRFWVSAKGANLRVRPLHLLHIRSALSSSFISQKRSLQLALNAFWLNTKPRKYVENLRKSTEYPENPRKSRKPSTGSQVQPVSSSVRHIIRTKLSYINLRPSRIAAPAYLFLIIFVKAGEIFGIYESAAA